MRILINLIMWCDCACVRVCTHTHTLLLYSLLQLILIETIRHLLQICKEFLNLVYYVIAKPLYFLEGPHYAGQRTPSSPQEWALV